MSNERFKFRVWDNINKKYDEAPFFIDEMGDLIRIDEFDDNIDRVQNQENFTIEQCTGLKDKNGSLIYEGDVVRYYRSTAMGLGGERIAQVLWDKRDAEFGILTTLGDGYNMWEALRFGIEIIGNIHEMESEND